MTTRFQPKVNEPNVWMFILKDKEDKSAATKFAAIKISEYDWMESNYIFYKAEMLNNATIQLALAEVPILLFFKKENEFASSACELV